MFKCSMNKFLLLNDSFKCLAIFNLCILSRAYVFFYIYVMPITNAELQLLKLKLFSDESSTQSFIRTNSVSMIKVVYTCTRSCQSLNYNNYNKSDKLYCKKLEVCRVISNGSLAIYKF